MKKLILFASIFSTMEIFAQEKQDSVSASKDIQEVLIKSQRKKKHTDHAAYTFGKEALEKARHSKDLLLTLPELQLDVTTNTVKSTRGGKVLFLINGIEANDNQIKSVAPTNVVRVEYFDIPPARFANRSDFVVNIITKNPEVGYSYGADVSSAVTTGFVNAMGYANYTKGKHDFGLEYNLNLRDYKNRENNNQISYKLNNDYYNSDYFSKDAFGYTYQDIVTRYTYVNPEKSTFQAKFTITPFTAFSNGNSSNIFTKIQLPKTIMLFLIASKTISTQRLICIIQKK